jgi:hypothetical protein
MASIGSVITRRIAIIYRLTSPWMIEISTLGASPDEVRAACKTSELAADSIEMH